MVYIIAGDIYERALAYLYDVKDADRDFKKFFVQFLNTLLLEALPYQNSILESSGCAKIAPFQVAALTDDVPFDERICGLALPYGIAAFYFEDEGKNGSAEEYRNRYIEALRDLQRATARGIADFY